MGLKKENEIHDRKVTTKLFDKRDAVRFYINYMSYLDSSILSKMFYVSVDSDSFGIVSTITDLIKMVTNMC